MKYPTSVYFFDEKQQLIRIVSKKYLTKNIQTKEITSNKGELINDKLVVSTVYDERIKGSAYMAVKELDGSFSMYAIQTSDDPNNRNEFVGINFAVKELEGFIVKDIRPKNQSIKSVAEQIISFTDREWRVGYVKPNLSAVTDTFYYLSVKDCLKQLQAHNCEIIFKCKIENQRITDKWIEIYDQIGTASNKRFTYGGSALSIVREQDRSQLYTSLIGRGKGEETGNGYGRRIEFSDVEWKKSQGDPIDKPKGQNYVELPDMTNLYGIPLKNGQMRKREGVAVFEEIDNKEKLLENTYNSLVEISRPLVQFKTTIFSGDEIGNTIQIHRYDRGYHYRARIFNMTIDRLTGKITSNVGDNLVKKSAIKTSSEIQMNIQKLDNEKVAFHTSEQIAKWQSDIIRGAKGGSFTLLNQQDLGIGEDRTPFAAVAMNGPSIATSDHFFVINSEGVGFIDGDFNLDNFHTAWTIDGVFNANFIQAGILSGPNFNLNLDTGDCTFAKGKITSLDKKSIFDLTNNYFKLDNGQSIRIDPGKLSIFDNSYKVAQFDSNGISFWRQEKAIGFVGVNTWKGFPFIKGIVFDLEYENGDYMTWAYRQNSTDKEYTTLFTLDPKGRTGYQKKGIFADLEFFANKGIYTNQIGSYGKSFTFNLGWTSFGGSNQPSISRGNVGIGMSLNELILFSGGKYITLTQIMDFMSKG